MIQEGLPTTVGDLMTRKVVTVSENDTLGSAEAGMSRFHFRHLPVVDGKKLIGLVTHSDLLAASSSWLSDEAEESDRVIHQLPLGKIMRREVVTVSEGDSLVDAARLMWQTKLGCLPVTNGEDELVGILTAADFLRLFVRTVDKDPPPPPSSIPPGHR